MTTEQREKPKASNSPIQANWAQIAVKYAQGIPSEELETEYGVKSSTIRQRAKRHGWSRKALSASHSDQINSNQSETAITPQIVSNPIVSVNKACHNVSQAAFSAAQKHKETYIGKLSEAGAVTATQALDEINKAQTLEEKALIYAAIEPMSRVMKPIYGLGQESTTNVNVQVNALSGFKPLGNQDVIDV